MDKYFRLSTENLNKLNSGLFYKPSKSILYKNSSRYKQTYRKPRSLYGFNEIRQFKQKGIIFVWPQRRRFFKSKEITLVAWFLANTFYWLHVMHFLPNGAGIYNTKFGDSVLQSSNPLAALSLIHEPPWNFRQPIPKPENRDYIIEPDWDSLYV